MGKGLYLNEELNGSLVSLLPCSNYGWNVGSYRNTMKSLVQRTSEEIKIELLMKYKSVLSPRFLFV